jgi:hypothetical protein
LIDGAIVKSMIGRDPGAARAAKAVLQALLRSD